MENKKAITIAEMAQKIDAALVAAGYKPSEAFASIWHKETAPGVIVERIYLKGKKANGYVFLADGAWKVEGVSFMMLLRIIEAAIK